ncbi:MAG TPA: hypothetical protein VIL72_15190 [Beijerinckiaceae bacterium]|jgi:DNA-binding transcriptional regulator YiaG
MNHHQFKSQLDSMQLSQARAAQLFGVDVESVERWVSGSEPIPRPVELATTLMVRGAMTAQEISSLIDSGAVLPAEDDGQD